MLKQDLFFRVIRKKSSYDYMFNNDSLNEYQNRTKNNMKDSLILEKKSNIIFESKEVQTVSNHPLMKNSDTIKAGDFQIKCFVAKKGFNTEIHGIINTFDISDQPIDIYSKQYDKGQYIGRWLIHSSYYAVNGKDTKGYSGGCFIMSTPDMVKLNRILVKEQVQPNDIIKGYLTEI